MSRESATAFSKRVKETPELQERFNAATVENFFDFAAQLGAENGFTFTPEELGKTKLHEFAIIVMKAPDLQAKLMAAPDKRAFCELIVELGREQGFTFTVEGVEKELRVLSKAARKQNEAVKRGEDTLVYVTWQDIDEDMVMSAQGTEQVLHCNSANMTCTSGTPLLIGEMGEKAYW